MPKGLNIATNFYNRLEARQAYELACKRAGVEPIPEYIELGWRRLDKLTAALNERVTDGTETKEKASGDPESDE